MLPLNKSEPMEYKDYVELPIYVLSYSQYLWEKYKDFRNYPASKGQAIRQYMKYLNNTGFYVKYRSE